MRIRTLTVIALTGLGLSGCSLWSKSDKADMATQSDASLRSTPQQDYQFDDQAYDVEIYDTSSQYTAYQYTGYDIEIYDPSQYYYYGYNDKGLRPLIVAETTDPRDAAFVKLNGPSQSVDWQNCESRHRGYIFMSDSEMRLDPEFEVCMRNKGYVLSTEYGPSSKTALSARTAGLRGRFSDTGTGSAFFR